MSGQSLHVKYHISHNKMQYFSQWVSDILVGWIGKRIKGVAFSFGFGSGICISLEALLEFLFGSLILAIKYLLPSGKRAKSRANRMFG